MRVKLTEQNKKKQPRISRPFPDSIAVRKSRRSTGGSDSKPSGCTAISLSVLAAALASQMPEALAADNETPADKPIGKETMATTFQREDASCFYGGIEYLYWWAKPAPLSVPLVSMGLSQFKEGFLVNSSATILYGAPYSPAQGGNDSQSFPGFSGTRFTVGYWLDDQHKFAVEGSAFILFEQSAGFSARGDSNGGYPAGSTTTGMRIPVYNNVPYAPGGSSDTETGLTLVPQGEDGVPLALPGDLTGGVTIKNTLQLWGAQALGVMNLYRDDTWDLSALAGFRYLDLSEKFELTADLEGLSTSDMYKGQSGVVSDTFETWNQFYGGDFGLRGRYTQGPWYWELTTTLAAGLSRETETVSGYYTAVNSPFGSGGPEGIFAQPANEGRTTSDRFAYVPEGQLKLGFEFSPCVRMTVGYTVLYYSNVIRPTDQISRAIPKGQTFQQDGTSPSTSSPSRRFQTTDFFTHGASVGLEISF
jgi:hypothetical protein